MQRRQVALNWFLLTPALLLLTFSLLIPLFYILINSIFLEEVSGFSLFYFKKFLTDEYYLGILWRTFWVGLLSTVLTIIPGYVLAYNMTFHPDPRWRALVVAVALVPLAVNLVIRVYGWMTILSPHGTIHTILAALGMEDVPVRLLFTETAMTIGFVHSHLTFMVLSIAGALMKIDSNLLRASQNLGAGPVRTFSNIILPLSMPGILAGSLLCFALNISDFVSPSLLGGNRNRMMTYLIYEQQLFLANDSFAAAETAILMAASALAIAGALRAAGSYGRRFGT